MRLNEKIPRRTSHGKLAKTSGGEYHARTTPKDGASIASVSGKSLIVTPLAFPLIAGPGAVSSVIIGQSEAVNMPQKFYVYAAVFLIMLTFYITFYIACSLSKYMKPAFMQICTKLFGILILAIGFKLMTFGVVGLLKGM